MTVLQARDYMERIRNDSMPRVSDTLFLDFINDLNHFTYESLLYANPEDYLLTQSYGVTSGANTYSLPSDFLSLVADGAGLYKTDTDGRIKGAPLIVVREDQEREGYYIDGDELKIVPVPTSAKTLVLKYVPDLAELENDSDTTVIPLRLKSYLKYFLNNSLEEWYRNPSAEIFNDQKFARAVSRFMANIKKAPRVLTLSNY